MKHILAAFLCIITPSINAATPAEGMMMKMECTQQGLTGEKELDEENVPWGVEYVRHGAEFTKDSKVVRVIAEFETNAKRMEGQIVAKAAAEGVSTLADGSFSLTSAALS